VRPVNSRFCVRKLLYATIATSLFTTALQLFALSIDIRPAIAQLPETPSLPIQGREDDTSIDIESQPPSVSDGTTLTTNASNIPPPAIEITSLEDGQEVPVGELTIEGTSSDDQESNCQVYADVNDITPMQNATAAGNGGEADYSQWTFTYTQDYQSITKGSNELTAKISCFNANNPTPISKWHSVNITGVTTGTSIAADEGTASSEEAPGTGEEGGNIGVVDIMPGVPPSG
jgi:hypothetical protein